MSVSICLYVSFRVASGVRGRPSGGWWEPTSGPARDRGDSLVADKPDHVFLEEGPLRGWVCPLLVESRSLLVVRQVDPGVLGVSGYLPRDPSTPTTHSLPPMTPADLSDLMSRRRFFGVHYGFRTGYGPDPHPTPSPFVSLGRRTLPSQTGVGLYLPDPETLGAPESCGGDSVTVGVWYTCVLRCRRRSCRGSLSVRHRTPVRRLGTRRRRPKARVDTGGVGRGSDV